MVTKSGKSALQVLKDDAFKCKGLWRFWISTAGEFVEGELDTHLFGDHFDYHST